MADKEKKLEHIQVKDNGIKSSQRLGDTLNEAKQLLERNIFDSLLSSANEKSLTRFKIAQNIAKADFTRKARDIIKNAKIEVKSGLENDKTVNLTPKQVKNITSEVDKGLLTLGNNAIKTYQNTVRDILLNVKSASDLKEQIGKHIKSGLDIDVIYKDGKKYKFDTYMEMKARTDIQQDIGTNMIAAGKEGGVIFYICSFYGDCAPDHADYQGKIYVDEKWESLAPKDRLEEIRNYIQSNDIKTVQAITENKPFLTTRPNCRHYFQYIDIDSVLGAKTQDDVKHLRQERGLNFGGKYQPDKYKALQQQRANERKIRAEKANVQSLELQKQLEPDNKNLQIMINNSKSNIRAYQANQRKLENQYTNIERRYDREALGNRVTLGTEKPLQQADLTNSQNSGNIDVEGIVQASIYSSKSTLLYKNAKNIKPIEGYFDVTCHSDGLAFYYTNDLGEETKFDVLKMAKYIRKDHTYVEGTPIRLISCSAGNEILAQTLANRLNTNVMAPTDIVNIYPDGELKLGANYEDTHQETGKWIVFKPEKRR